LKKRYIGSDSPENKICQNIIKKYSNISILNYDEVNTIKFRSTNKYIILSNESFSAIIGYLSFFSEVYYPEYKEDKIWYGDMFSIPNWKKINY
jgi:hypothetical protein